MILMGATIEADDAKRLLALLDKAGNNLPLRRLRVIGERSVQRTISEGGRPKRWAPIKASSSEARRDVKKIRSKSTNPRASTIERAVSRHKPLMDTGRLRQSIQSQNIGKTNLKVFSHVEYAAWQNWGTGIYGPRGRAFAVLPKTRKALMWMAAGGVPAFSRGHMHPGIPARPFMVWQDEDVSAMVAVVTEHIKATGRAA